MTAKSRKHQIESMLAEDPKDPFLRYGLAMEYASEGNDEQAVKCLRDLLALTPDYVPAYLQAGQMLTRLEKTDEARDIFRTGIAVAKRLGDSHAAGEMEAFLDGLS
ncbi:MAG: tetratricopeptide repeat protein [Gemmataceae bacterium]